MLYVDGMNGVIQHNETIQWLYQLLSSKVCHIVLIPPILLLRLPMLACLYFLEILERCSVAMDAV